jgi:hypothetical protein
MSDLQPPPQTQATDREPVELPRPRRSRASKLLEFLFWIALAFLTAWILVQNIESILPANNF